jgi:hypothetical protein
MPLGGRRLVRERPRVRSMPETLHRAYEGRHYLPGNGSLSQKGLSDGGQATPFCLNQARQRCQPSFAASGR